MLMMKFRRKETYLQWRSGVYVVEGAWGRTAVYSIYSGSKTGIGGEDLVGNLKDTKNW